MTGAPGPPWATGFARYWIDQTVGPHSLPVAVRCKLGDLGMEILALLDTGAVWSVIGQEVAQLLSGELTDAGSEITMSTRLGSIRGELHRLRVKLLATEGDDLDVEATVVVAPEWTGPVVPGYRGFLERLRLGLDPGITQDDPWLAFGAGDVSE